MHGTHTFGVRSVRISVVVFKEHCVYVNKNRNVSFLYKESNTHESPTPTNYL